jgi:hypothetical protein
MEDISVYQCLSEVKSTINQYIFCSKTGDGGIPKIIKVQAQLSLL